MIREFISKIPVPVCGLSLGLASLDRFFWYYYGDIYTFNIFALFAFIIAAMFTIRLIIDIKGVIKDVQTPAVFGVVPTYTMTLMLLAAYAKDHVGGIVGDVALVIWLSAIAASFVLMVIFIRKAFFSFSMDRVFPSWVIIFVGYVVASVTSPSFGMENLGRIIFWSGFFGYLFIIPVIAYRTVRIRMPESLVPQIAIITAPANLCVVGCMAAYGNDPTGATAVAFTIVAVMGLISYAAVMAYMPVLLNRRFYPSFAALTFPLVISATAFYKLGEYYGVSSGIYDIILKIMIAAAILIVVYVLIRYTMYFYKTAKEAHSSAKSQKIG